MQINFIHPGIEHRCDDQALVSHRHAPGMLEPRLFSDSHQRVDRQHGNAGAVIGAQGQALRDWLRTKANSIEGGTSEVQLNIISKRVLGLPD